MADLSIIVGYSGVGVDGKIVNDSERVVGIGRLIGTGAGLKVLLDGRVDAVCCATETKPSSVDAALWKALSAYM